MKIAVAVGHTLNGEDHGVVSLLDESVCTREIGEKVKSYLEILGNEVVLCRIDRASSVDESLRHRVNLANRENVELFLEIHLNSGGEEGVETYIANTGGKAEGYANNVQKAMAGVGYKDRGVKVANSYVIKYTNAPAILIESGFVDNENDVKRYNPQLIGKAIVKGITGQVVKDSLVTTTHADSAYKYNAVVINHWFYGRLEDGTVEEGQRVDIGDKIKVLDISYSRQLALVEYPTSTGTRETYIKNTTSNIKYLNDSYFIEGYKDVYDRFSGNRIGSISNEEVIVLEYLGEKINVAYSTDKGSWTKSGVINK